MLPRGALGLACLLLLSSLALSQSAKTKDLMKGVLSDKSPKDRVVAAEELGNLAAIKLSEAKLALPVLRTALYKDADPTVRKAALEMGFTPDAASRMVLGTFAGAIKLAESSAEDVAVLRERVTSKGGTTEQALARMHADKVLDNVCAAVHAARTRAAELGVAFGKAD